MYISFIHKKKKEKKLYSKYCSLLSIAYHRLITLNTTYKNKTISWGGTKYAPPLLECMYNIIASLETMYLKRLKNITVS